MALGSGLDGADKGLFIADVGHSRFGLAAGLANGTGHRFQGRQGAPAQHYLGAFLSHARGGGSTDP
ncbi:hypothetical protein D3C78_1834740 [compost metagenome]